MKENEDFSLPDDSKEESLNLDDGTIEEGIIKEPERDPMLEKLLQSGSDSENEDDLIKKLSKKSKGSKKKTIIFSSVGFVVLIAAAVGSFFVVNNGPNIESKEKETRAITEKVKETEEGVPFWQTEEGGAETPIEEFTWESDLLNNVGEMTPELRGEIISSLAGSDLFAAAGILPSEAAGFTSDDELELLEDGTINPMYSYWTMESFVSETGRTIQSLLNPSFGMWVVHQYPGDNNNEFKLENTSNLKLLFTNNFLESISDKTPSEYMPIYADWANDNYGEKNLLDSGPRWYGEITSSTSEFVYDEETFSYTVNFVGNVKYTAFTKDGGKIEKNGVLKLTLVPNQGFENGEVGKVLIDKANLTIGG